MKKVKLNLLVLMLLFACIHLGGETLNVTPKSAQKLNNTAILLIHGFPGQGDSDERDLDKKDPPWGSLPDYLEEYLEGDFWTENNKGDANRLFVYVNGFGEDKDDDERFTTYVTGAYDIGNDPDKWINRVRSEWNNRYNHIFINGYDPNWSNLITTEYPEKIILITHSAGGLTARAYLTDENNWRKEGGNPVLDVSQIITAQSTHTGVDIVPKNIIKSFYGISSLLYILGATELALGNPGGLVKIWAGVILSFIAISANLFSDFYLPGAADYSYYSPNLIILNNKDLTHEMQKVEWGNIYIDDVICTVSTASRPPTKKTGNDFIEFVFYIIGLISPVGFGDGWVPASSQRGFTWENKLDCIENGKNYRINAGALDFGAHFRKNNFNNFTKWGYFLNDWSSKSINKGTLEYSEFKLMEPGGSTKPGLLMEIPADATTTSKSTGAKTTGEDEPEYGELDCIDLKGGDFKADMILEGKILDFLPHKLQHCRISFNFGDWHDILMVTNDDFADSDFLFEDEDKNNYIRDMYGNYKIGINDHVLEGQNILKLLEIFV